MGKRYSKASEDVIHRVARLREKYYPELEGVTITCLFVFSDENEQVLTHQGYPALATVKKTSTRDRAAGLADAIIVVDRYAYSTMTGRQSDALLDHELYHLEPVLDETGTVAADAIGRPKLTMRLHDRQYGWFDKIAERHGDASIEVSQAKLLADTSGQLYFDFSKAAA